MFAFLIFNASINKDVNTAEENKQKKNPTWSEIIKETLMY